MSVTSRRVTCVIGLICAASSLPAQTPQGATADGISRWTQRVDAGLSRMRRTVVDLPGASTEGGQLVLYGVGGSLQKLVAIYAGETGKTTECYYAANDTFRYFVRKEVQYDRPLSGRVARSTVERFWFAGDTAIQWRDTLGRIVRTGENLKSRGAEIRRDFRNTFQMSHQGYVSRTGMSNVRCN